MLKTQIEVTGLKELNKRIEFIKKMTSMKTDKSFQKFIQDKSMKALEQVMSERLVGGTSNDDSISLYKSSNHIKETEDGFIIYNDSQIPANVKGVQNDIANYPNGMFSIALAFEYGVGIVGEWSAGVMGTETAWEYNKQGYNFGWVLPREVALKLSGGETGKVEYAGYAGFGIYHYTAEKIRKDLSSWVEEYYRKNSEV